MGDGRKDMRQIVRACPECCNDWPIVTLRRAWEAMCIWCWGRKPKVDEARFMCRASQKDRLPGTEPKAECSFDYCPLIAALREELNGDS